MSLEHVERFNPPLPRGHACLPFEYPVVKESDLVTSNESQRPFWIKVTNDDFQLFSSNNTCIFWNVSNNVRPVACSCNHCTTYSSLHRKWPTLLAYLLNFYPGQQHSVVPGSYCRLMCDVPASCYVTFALPLTMFCSGTQSFSFSACLFLDQVFLSLQVSWYLAIRGNNSAQLSLGFRVACPLRNF